jgi:hypothetical protein
MWIFDVIIIRNIDFIVKIPKNFYFALLERKSNKFTLIKTELNNYNIWNMK